MYSINLAENHCELNNRLKSFRQNNVFNNFIYQMSMFI